MIRGRRWVSTWGAAWLAALPGWRQAARAAVIPAFPAPDLSFVMEDGTVLPARLWPAAATVKRKGVMLALHGFTDSRDAWAEAAPVFAAAGWMVVAPDQRGFGATVTRGVWAGGSVMVRDAAALASQLRQIYPGRLVILGESMGSAVAMCLAAREPDAADEFVLTSPAVWGRGQMPPAYVAALWAANRVAPGWKLTGQEVPLDIAASDNNEALLALAQDPLTLRGSTVAMLAGLVDLMSRAQQAASRLPAGKTLVLCGRRDQIVPLPAAAAALRKMPEGVRIGFYLNGFHLLLRDLGRALVEADILAWLEQPESWLPSGADVNAAAWLADHGWDAGAPGGLPAADLDGQGERRVWPY